MLSLVPSTVEWRAGRRARLIDCYILDLSTLVLCLGLGLSVYFRGLEVGWVGVFKFEKDEERTGKRQREIGKGQ